MADVGLARLCTRGAVERRCDRWHSVVKQGCARRSITNRRVNILPIGTLTWSEIATVVETPEPLAAGAVASGAEHRSLHSDLTALNS